jgi:hypothetical protein
MQQQILQMRAPLATDETKHQLYRLKQMQEEIERKNRIQRNETQQLIRDIYQMQVSMPLEPRVSP